MLQQTQVAVVVAYFQRWMNLFPTVQALAAAPLEKVLKVWEGLGYYSRARNLHQGAQYLMKHHEGELPPNREELKNVKGLGPYTVGAVLSFAFKQKAPAVDGNVLRVLARYFCIEEEIDKGATRKKIEQLTHDLLPNTEPWVVMEALIELGALICKKKPSCHLCPLQQSCKAFKLCKAELLPLKKPRAKTTHLHRTVAVIHTGKKVLMQQGEKGKVMADLWEFPYFDQGCDVAKELNLSMEHVQELPQFNHGFTRYKVFLYPHLYLAEQEDVKNYQWLPYESLGAKAFSSGHRQVLQWLRKNKVLPI